MFDILYARRRANAKGLEIREYNWSGWDSNGIRTGPPIDFFGPQYLATACPALLTPDREIVRTIDGGEWTRGLYAVELDEFCKAGCVQAAKDYGLPCEISEDGTSL